MEKMNTRRPIKLLDNILDQAKWVDPGVRPGGAQAGGHFDYDVTNFYMLAHKLHRLD